MIMLIARCDIVMNMTPFVHQLIIAWSRQLRRPAYHGTSYDLPNILAQGLLPDHRA